MSTLLHAVRRYAEAYADANGLAQTPIPGLTAVRATVPSGLVHAVSRPLVCLVLQGAKQVTMGTRAFAFAAGESLLITADVPTVSQITRESVAAPYVSLALELDAAVIADLAVQMRAVPTADHAPVRIEPTDAEVADAALRLMRLLDRPESVPVLSTQLVRELHYWLLAGRHGAAIRRLGWPGSCAACGPRGRRPASRIQTSGAGRASGGCGRHESVIISPALPHGDLAVSAPISETIALDRGEAADAVGGSDCE